MIHLSLSLYIYIYTQIHIYTYMYIYIYIALLLCEPLLCDPGAETPILPPIQRRQNLCL